jgi:hypothetical protein
VASRVLVADGVRHDLCVSVPRQAASAIRRVQLSASAAPRQRSFPLRPRLELRPRSRGFCWTRRMRDLTWFDGFLDTWRLLATYPIVTVIGNERRHWMRPPGQSQTSCSPRSRWHPSPSPQTAWSVYPLPALKGPHQTASRRLPLHCHGGNARRSRGLTQAVVRRFGCTRSTHTNGQRTVWGGRNHLVFVLARLAYSGGDCYEPSRRPQHRGERSSPL